MALRKFQRSRTDRKLAGLFGGLGDAFGVDPTYLRLAFVLMAVLTGIIPALAGYALGWLITQEGHDPSEGPDTRSGDPVSGHGQSAGDGASSPT